MKDTPEQAPGSTHVPQPTASTPTASLPPEVLEDKERGVCHPLYTLFIMCLEKSTCEDTVEFSILEGVLSLSFK